MLRNGSDLQVQYAIIVHNRFQPPKDIDESTTDKCEQFIKANKEASQGEKRGYDIHVSESRENVSKVYEGIPTRHSGGEPAGVQTSRRTWRPTTRYYRGISTAG